MFLDETARLDRFLSSIILPNPLIIVLALSSQTLTFKPVSFPINLSSPSKGAEPPVIWIPVSIISDAISGGVLSSILNRIYY